MSLHALRASLALWRRRHAFRAHRLDRARAAHDQARERKWHKLLLKSGKKVRQRERQIAARTVRGRTIAHALGFVGTTEQPAGSNRGPLISAWATRLGFPGGGVPWCGIFAGNMLLWAGVTGVSGRIAAVALIEDDARAGLGPFTTWTTDPRHVRAGDLVVLFGRGVHVAMVRHIAGGLVYTVEGNTSSGDVGNQSNGGGVFTRARPLAAVHGFACVRYPS